MSETVKLTAADGHMLDAYVARPAAQPIAGLVVVQEIFGVNVHIRSVTDRFAREGFLAVAPALFDRIEPGVDLRYDEEDMKKAMSLLPKLNIDNAVQDTAAALDFVHAQTGKKCGVVGYCFGGTIAWLASTRLGADAAVGYYGGRISNYADEQPKSPVMLHFGEQDSHIPKSDVERVQALHPELKIFWYPAGHGFNCDMRSSFDAESSRLALERTLAFLKQNLKEPG